MVVEGCFDDGAIFSAILWEIIQEIDEFGGGGNYHDMSETICRKLFSSDTIKLLRKLILKKDVPARKINFIHENTV